MFSKKAISSKASSSKGSSSKGSGSSSDQSPILVCALWDHENTRLPPGYDITRLKAFIDMSLKKQNPRFQLDMLVAIGPHRPSYHPGIEYRRLKRANVMCKGEPKSVDCYDFIIDDDRSNEEKVRRNTDVADIQIIIDLILRIHMEKKDFLIIAGDIDFLDLMRTFSAGTDIKFMVAVNDRVNPRLLNVASAIWLWNSANPNAQSMIYGGRPTPRW